MHVGKREWIRNDLSENVKEETVRNEKTCSNACDEERKLRCTMEIFRKRNHK